MAKKRFQSGRRLPPGKVPSEKGLLKQSSQWPLLECIISDDWQISTNLTQICIARQATSGEIAVGVFLIDQACLGVKTAYGRIFNSPRQYREEIRTRMSSSLRMISCDVDMAAKIIEEGINYANSIGFKPDKDIKYAYLVMGKTNPENFADVEVPVGGKDGKPFYFAGPYDDADRIIRILNRKVGEGNYDFVVPLGDPDFFDDDDWADEEWDELE